MGMRIEIHIEKSQRDRCARVPRLQDTRYFVRGTARYSKYSSFRDHDAYKDGLVILKEETRLTKQ